MLKDAEWPLCGRLHAITATPDAHKPHHQCDPRFRQGVEHLHSLGPRPLAEFLAELGAEHDIVEPISAKLTAWRERLTREMVRAVGGDRWPPLLSLLVGGK